jgi:hypothetical protein
MLRGCFVLSRRRLTEAAWSKKGAGAKTDPTKNRGQRKNGARGRGVGTSKFYRLPNPVRTAKARFHDFHEESRH